MGVFFLFLLALTAGSISTFYWIPEEDLGRGYFQMNALIVVSLLGLATTVYLLHPFRPFGDQAAIGETALACAVAGAFLYYAAIWRERWRLGRWAATLSLAGTATGLFLAGEHLVRLGAHQLLNLRPLLAIGLTSSALLLGWSLITMLLGHWYLVSPKLTFSHLVIFCWVLLGIVGLRLLAIGASMVAVAMTDAAVYPHPWALLSSFAGQGMFFWFRLFWGLAIPLGLALMSLHCARQRSNQSATGILYVLVVGAFVGEITALYITLVTGVPV